MFNQVGKHCGRASNGLFSYVEDGKMKMGRRHRTMTKNARERYFALRAQEARRAGDFR